MSEMDSAVAVYGTHSQAQEAVKELQKSGFDMKKISIVGKHHTDEQVGRYDNTGDRMKYWGKMGPTRAVCGGGCSESRSL